MSRPGGTCPDTDLPIVLTSPEDARTNLRLLANEDELSFHVRYLHALNVVETVMESHFRGDSFRVGFAASPLGGGDGWLAEDMVPHIREAAEAAGWLVSIEGSFLVFTAPSETT